jgi:hypothetical protein
MKDFDSDYYSLPHVPFMVELETLCFVVEVPMCKAQQEDYLKNFDYLDAPLRNPPAIMKAEWLEATCSAFLIIGKGDFTLKVCPEDYFMERNIALNAPYITKYYELADDDEAMPECLIYHTSSLDEIPAYGYEAWAIYSGYKDALIVNKINNMIDLLNSNQVSVVHIMSKPTFKERYLALRNVSGNQHFRDFEKAVTVQIAQGKPIKRKSKPESFTKLNMLESFRYLREKGVKKTPAARAVINMFFNDDSKDFKREVDNFLKLIDRKNPKG